MSAENITAVLADLRAEVEATVDHAWDCDADKPRGAGMPCTCPITDVLVLIAHWSATR